MKRVRLTSWIVFVGMLLLVAGIGLSESILAEWHQSNGSKGLDKLVVNVDLAAGPTGSAGLTIAEADKLAEKWGRAAAYSARTAAAVSTEDNSVSADVIGVGGRYDSFAHIRLYRGSLLTAKSIEEHSRVALVSARLAEKLFMNRDVVGMKLRLMGSTFTIVGVYEQPDTLLDRMTDDGRPDVLVPITTMVDLDSAVKVATIELEAGPTAVVTGVADAKNALAGIGKQPSRYKIVTYVTEQHWVGQKPKLLLAAAGAAAILLGLRLAAGRLKRSVGLMRQGTATLDWQDAVRRFRKQLAFDAGSLLVLAACAAALYAAIRHRFYVPAELVPDVLIDWTFYRDKWLEWWQSLTAARGYVSSPGELLHERVNMLVTRLTAAGIWIGLPLFWIGVREWAMTSMAPEGRLVRLALFFGGAVLVCAVAAWWAGADYVIRGRELFVLGGLFGLAALMAKSKQNSKSPGRNETIRKGGSNDAEQHL
ncbi:ABC transporter permease [Paenibacillus mesophilus]|uniref:ABC transporter permease n=1 Tax=Paenibacillus mesophilus TaxID=2582849 RepID=UPI00110E218F|nr:ABC transporter permease [Paenibacillus mesophilus]TMV51480.1 ABC transporter permease [Paenibacillus mesophilus]